MDRIYLDHAATTPIRPYAIRAMENVMENFYGNPSAQYESAREAKAIVESARNKVAKAIHASADEIFFTSCGTESNNWVLRSFTAINGKSNILTTPVEHHAVLHTCESLKAQGMNTDFFKVDEYGKILISGSNEKLFDQCGLVSVMSANNELGTLEPISQVAEKAHRYGALFHTDAVQAVGHIPVDVRDSEVDFLSMSAHKFGGPKGIGALYIRKGTRLKPFITGGEQEREKRAGTESTVLIAGMGAAIEEAIKDMPIISEHILSLQNELRIGIKTNFPFAQINTSENDSLPGLLNVSFIGYQSRMVLALLDMNGVEVSAGSACTAGSASPSHVLLATGHDFASTESAIRFIIGHENTMAQMHHTIEVLKNAFHTISGAEITF